MDGYSGMGDAVWREQTNFLKWMQCNECGFALPPYVFGSSICSECGSPMHIHNNSDGAVPPTKKE